MSAPKSKPLPSLSGGEGPGRKALRASYDWSSAACAAAMRAVGTRYGEQET